MNQRKRRIKAANKWIYDCSVATDKFWAKRGYNRISYKGESIFASGPREYSRVCLKIRDYHPGAYRYLGQDVLDHD